MTRAEAYKVVYGGTPAYALPSRYMRRSITHYPRGGVMGQTTIERTRDRLRALRDSITSGKIWTYDGV